MFKTIFTPYLCIFFANYPINFSVWKKGVVKHLILGWCITVFKKEERIGKIIFYVLFILFLFSSILSYSFFFILRKTPGGGEKDPRGRENDPRPPPLPATPLVCSEGIKVWKDFYCFFFHLNFLTTFHFFFPWMGKNV